MQATRSKETIITWCLPILTIKTYVQPYVHHQAYTSCILPTHTPPRRPSPFLALQHYRPALQKFNKGTKYLANNAFAMVTKPDLAMYYHCTAFSPVPTKFISAINNSNFSTWPGLTAELISKHLPKSLATTKGHNNLARQNLRSTRHQDPTQDLPVSRTKTIHITVI